MDEETVDPVREVLYLKSCLKLFQEVPQPLRECLKLSHQSVKTFVSSICPVNEHGEVLVLPTGP